MFALITAADVAISTDAATVCVEPSLNVIPVAPRSMLPVVTLAVVMLPVTNRSTPMVDDPAIADALPVIMLAETLPATRLPDTMVLLFSTQLLAG